MLNYYYSDTISDFCSKYHAMIIGEISTNSGYGHIPTELQAWTQQIVILKEQLRDFEGHLFFEFSIPRMGKRVDCLLIIQDIVFVIEFKVGESTYLNIDIDQVWDYALDLKNFHKPSQDLLLVPVLVATDATTNDATVGSTGHKDKLLHPIKTNSSSLGIIIQKVLDSYGSNQSVNALDYVSGSYSPTPSIIEAAIKLYNNHTVDDITRNDADVINLTLTTSYISDTIEYAKKNNRKIICFVTGVPGAGKTLVGLKVATEHLDKSQGNTSVFLSGNKPLVDILQEALTRDRVTQEKLKGIKLTKREARESVKAFIQIIHHYRDEYLRDKKHHMIMSQSLMKHKEHGPKNRQ